MNRICVYKQLTKRPELLITFILNSNIWLVLVRHGECVSTHFVPEVSAGKSGTKIPVLSIFKKHFKD